LLAADRDEDAVAVEVADPVGAETAVGKASVDQLVVAESPGAERVDKPIGPGGGVADLGPAGMGFEKPDLDASLCQIRGSTSVEGSIGVVAPSRL
jgi:hypothetical protein